MSRKEVQTEVLKDIITGIFVSVLIFSSGFYLPLLGFFLALLLPMPILFYRLKLGRKPGAIIMAAVIAAIAAVTGGISVDIIFYGSLLVTGFFLGEFIELQLSVEKTGIYTCLATLLTSAACLLLYSVITGQGLFSLVSNYVAANLEMTLKIYANIGVPKENIEMISRSLEIIQYVLVRILPALITALLMFTTWVNILFIKTILARKGINLQQFKALNRWQAPDYLVWSVIVFGLMMFIPVRAFKLFGLNFIIILMPAYFFQGIAIVSFFFQKKKFPSALRFFIYGIIVIQQIFVLLIIGIGFFDTWIDFRKLNLISNTEEQN